MDEIRTYPIGSRPYRNLERLSELLTENSMNGYHYYVGDAYLDYNKGWKYTTVLCDVGKHRIHCLSFEQYEMTISAHKEYSLQMVVDEFFKDKDCFDRRNSLFAI